MFDSEWTPEYQVDGVTVDDPLRLYQVRGGGWVWPSPRACRNGHPLGANRVLVGAHPCMHLRDQYGRAHHRTHECVACGAVIYTPVTPDCDHPGMTD
ncbi:hypothetical protein [Nocardia bovistercoris]|uniref:Uncharacterized protein n=1 Tax=Nocardia bovistercoris TaxID=2785916 RepID=A0A931N732_9NOCA|nr:hypothetical protein [Nocardia bovistercoris]MBH0780338.1 hypothetical protein [Nocardia bovistercoris]